MVSPSSILVLALAVLLAGATARAASPDSCRDCHKSEKFRVQNKKIYDYFQDWKGSPHDAAGVSCTSCHNGDPEAASAEEAHRGVLPQSSPTSPVHYKNIPKTCGSCHEPIYERFIKSRHYELLAAEGRGPSCINCHGSVSARVYYTAVIERACAECHNERSGNHPEIVGRAKDVISRMNHARGYQRGLSFYYEAVGQGRRMSRVNSLYEAAVRAWHSFDLAVLDKSSRELVRELKALYLKARKEREAAREKKAP